ncbi:MAG: TRAP transporter small permease [Bacteroidetes bacterium]|nr:TRAP transporter small permease [Bacteroidota bacterium]MDA1120508.1 TRAP transporter small permease [Bacteroidota bacterium]
MKKAIDKALGSVLVFLMAVLVVAVLWQIFSRYVIQSPSTFTDELSRYMLIWIGLLGAAYASGQRQHLSINILPPKLNEKNRIRLRIIQNITIMVFVALALIIGGSRLVFITYYLDQHSPALNLSLAAVYIIIPISGILIITYLVLELLSPESLKNE